MICNGRQIKKKMNSMKGGFLENIDDSPSEFNDSIAFSGGVYGGLSVRLKCANSVTDSIANKPFSPGYTGKRFKESFPEMGSKMIVPSGGFTGSYRGKIHGKIGRSDVHNQSISLAEPECEDVSIARKHYHYRTQNRSESFNCNQYTSLNYELSRYQSTARGQPADRVLDDISRRLEVKYTGPMQRHLHVRNIFALYDLSGSELCSVDEFYAALMNLGVMLPNVEFEALCEVFDEQRSGEISWTKFMNRIGAGIVAKK